MFTVMYPGKLNVVSVVLSGGSGSRLWPSSRLSLPKQFIEFEKNSTLFSETIRRINKDKTSNLTVVSNKAHNFLCRREVTRNDLEACYILEEIGRNTATAILMAALNYEDDDVLVIMPADHWIEDKKSFNKAIDKAVSIAYEQKCWVTFGVNPTEPKTGYGYISASYDGDIRTVNSFKEKPDFSTAKSYLSDGNYFWNSGIFVVTVAKCKESFKSHQNKLYEEAVNCWFNKHIWQDEVTLLSEHLKKIPSISIDYAILEKEANIAMMPFEGKWSDVGNWDSLSMMLDESKSFGNMKDNIINIDTKNTFVFSSARTIAAIGVEDLIIVDDDDATLVVKKGESEKVKQALDLLKSLNVSSALEHTFEYRPWGIFENLLNSEICKVKRLTVNPGQHLSLQYHHKRSEHWIVVRGTATVHLGEDIINLKEGNSIDIPLGEKHALGNDTETDLIVIEVQMGSYFGEDDIVRISDPYNR